ncbi:hypothetical protein AVEN_247231-1 [Araneus ventricosus]|uniref:Uncharacterized protein n=1 Tax=Araneus ventricosus TaxID=182803 RepID=A0A4Y2EQL3_ARAVE|nr:hypothetical protein AVEN_247231-1 [Araneus ventricosus]
MGNFSRLRELLSYGGNSNIQDDNGETPLHLAGFKVQENPQDCEHNLQVARVLINFGKNVDQMNNPGNTPLPFATARRNYKMIEILLQSKSEIDLKDNDGNAEQNTTSCPCDYNILVI